MSWRRLLAVAALMALPLAALAPVSSAGAASSLAHPPKGANDFSCKPSAAHPYPLVLVHGLGATMAENWFSLAPILAARGYCVFALTYGINPKYPYFGGVEPIEQSAPELGAFVDQVLAATGASKVDLIGHSEGTFMPEYWLKFLGGAAEVNQYIALAPLYQGTNLAGLAALRDLFAPTGLSQQALDAVARYCGSCPEFLAGSPMVQALNSGPGGAAVPGVHYTTIMSSHDEVVVPYTSGSLAAPNATNIVVQKVCPDDLSEHVALAFDPVVAQLVLNALDPANAHKVSCAGLPPFGPEPKA
ncbi:MAG TPA: alpha/beta fold hydrolase [Acidimicrobiales bacterium]|jgi:triacylglycerol esterase/lipase EstA (alpha/beta hydrolase family)